MAQPSLSGLPIFVLENLLKQCTLPVLVDLANCNKTLLSIIRSLRFSPPTLDILVRDYHTVVSAEKSMWILQNHDSLGNYPSCNPVADFDLGGVQVSVIRDDFYNQPLYQVFHDCHVKLAAHFLSHLKNLFPRSLKFNFRFENLSEEISSKVVTLLPLTEAETLDVDDLQLSKKALDKILEALNVETFKKYSSRLTLKDLSRIIETFRSHEYQKLRYMSIGVYGLVPFPVVTHPDRPKFFITPEGERIDCTGGWDGARKDGTVYTVLLTPRDGSHLFHFMVWPRELVQGPVYRD